MIGITAEDLLATEIQPKRFLLKPFVHQASLTLLYAPTGIGKSLFALSLAASIASASPFLDWECNEAWKCLYIDGEMTLGDTKERLQAIINGLSKPIVPGHLRVINNAHFAHNTMPPLGTSEGQKWFIQEAKLYDLVIVDNLGCVAPRDSRQTDEQNWMAIAPMLIKLRNAGKAIILIHHAGKSGEQLGTSLKTQAVDYCVSLTRPIIAEEGETSFYVDFEKVRGKHRQFLRNLFCRITPDDTTIRWTYQTMKKHMDSLIKRMSEHLSEREISEALHLPTFKIKQALLAESAETLEYPDYYQD